MDLPPLCSSTVTDSMMVEHEQTYNFIVLPKNNVEQLTTAATWPEVVAPDRLQAAQEMVAGPNYSLSLATGAVWKGIVAEQTQMRELVIEGAELGLERPHRPLRRHHREVPFLQRQQRFKFLVHCSSSMRS